jgi:small-conductance mechanosensitive channel
MLRAVLEGLDNAVDKAVDSLPTWATAAAYVTLWLLVGILLRRLLRRWLGDFARSNPSEVAEVIADAVPRPAGMAVFLAGLAGGLRFLTVPETRLLELHKILAFSLATLGVILVMRVAFKAIEAYGRSNPALRSSAGIGKALTWIAGLALVGVLASDTLGISPAPALTAFGVGSIAVALAVQDSLSNFFSGLYIIIDKPIRPGDFVRVDPSYEGYVASIGWRSTQLRTVSNNLVIIPNATLSKAIITNYSLPSPHMASNVRVDVPADADVDKVLATLAEVTETVKDISGVAATPVPSVVLVPGFVDGGIAFTISYSVSSISEQQNVQHAVRMRIAARFRAANIALRKSALG